MALGTYVFDRVSTYLNDFHKLCESILSLTFTLKPGQIIYVGEIMVTVSNCTYDDGEDEDTYKAKFDYQVSDQCQRDKLIVKKKYKNIDINTVKLNITSI